MAVAARALVAAVVLVTAGCAGFGFGETDIAETATTPVAVPEGTTGGSPGVGPDGVGSPELLGQAHGAVLNGTGYTLRANRTAVYPNGTLHSRLSVGVHLAANRTYRTEITVAGGGAPVLLGRPPARATFWSDGDRFLRRLVRDNRTVHNEYTPPDSYAGTWRYWVRSVALDGRAPRDVAETLGAFRTTVENRSGRRYVVGTGLRGDQFRGTPVVDPANATLTARVTPRGFVPFYRVRYTTRTDAGDPVTVTRTIRYSDVGNTTVGRPPWYDRAVDG